MKTATLERAATVALVAAMLLTPLLAGAEPFAQAPTQAKAYALAILTPIVALVILVIGAMCFAGRIAWGYLGAAFIGAGLIFGHEQIATMIKSWVA